MPTCIAGRSSLKRVYDALRSNPRVWEKTLLLITYDEHGGLYDHVVPPIADVLSPGSPGKVDTGGGAACCSARAIGPRRWAIRNRRACWPGRSSRTKKRMRAARARWLGADRRARRSRSRSRRCETIRVRVPVLARRGRLGEPAVAAAAADTRARPHPLRCARADLRRVAMGQARQGPEPGTGPLLDPEDRACALRGRQRPFLNDRVHASQSFEAFLTEAQPRTSVPPSPTLGNLPIDVRLVPPDGSQIVTPPLSRKQMREGEADFHEISGRLARMLGR